MGFTILYVGLVSLCLRRFYEFDGHGDKVNYDKHMFLFHLVIPSIIYGAVFSTLPSSHTSSI
jgi:hypothetical protein